MECRCCREYLDGFVTFAEIASDTCNDCAQEHDREHGPQWREKAQAAQSE